MTADLPVTPSARHPLAVPLVVVLTPLGVVLDQATKLVALRTLELGRFVPLVGDHVGWQLVGNPGAAFGLPVPAPLFLVVAGLVAVIVVRSLRTTASLLQASAYGLLLAGAIGNLIDRVVRAGEGFLDGEVVDFVAWGSFPRFNVADSLITVGFAVLVVALLLEDRRVAAAERAAAGSAAAGSAAAEGTATESGADDPAAADRDAAEPPGA